MSRNKHLTAVHFGSKNALARNGKVVINNLKKEDRKGVLAHYDDLIPFPSINKAKHFMRTGS
jgi:hypothetical protein